MSRIKDAFAKFFTSEDSIWNGPNWRVPPPPPKREYDALRHAQATEELDLRINDDAVKDAWERYQVVLQLKRQL